MAAMNKVVAGTVIGWTFWFMWLTTYLAALSSSGQLAMNSGQSCLGLLSIVAALPLWKSKASGPWSCGAFTVLFAIGGIYASIQYRNVGLAFLYVPILFCLCFCIWCIAFSRRWLDANDLSFKTVVAEAIKSPEDGPDLAKLFARKGTTEDELENSPCAGVPGPDATENSGTSRSLLAFTAAKREADAVISPPDGAPAYDREGPLESKSQSVLSEAPPPIYPTQSRSTILAEELSKLADLWERGILSDEEFRRAKEIILGGSNA